MGRYCFGAFLKVLSLCSPRSTTNKYLCGTMFLAVNESYDIRTDDGTVGHLINCSLLTESIEPQQLSVVTALSVEQKKQIVEVLKSGKAEFPKALCPDEEAYSLMRKFANILLKDIVKGRNSRVHQEFQEYLSLEDEKAITELFENRENSPDDDINLSLDQTERLAHEIRRGLRYPALRVDGMANYNELYSFLDRLRDIFKWDTYESDTLGFFNPNTQKYSKLAHYTFVLNQWVSGMGLNSMIVNAIDHDTGNSKAKVKVNGRYVPFQPTPVHINALISGLLEDIDNIIVFRLANYFLRFSQEHKAIFPDEKFRDWYEFVEYGCSNPFTIWLQRNGFSREVATYIKNNVAKYFSSGDDDEYRLKKRLLQCEDQGVRREAQQVYYNSPEIFV